MFSTVKYQPTAKIIALCALTAFALATSGCTRLRAHQGYVGDSVLLQSVSPGVDNKASVEASLGRPTFVGQFGSNDWYYYARDTKQLAFAKPKASGQYVLHVEFDKQGNVTSVKQSAMENIVNINPESDKTPTLGRNTGFFEELFGNIGTVGAPGTTGGSSQP